MERFELERNFKCEKMLEELESVEDGDNVSFRGIVYIIYSSILSRSLTHSCRANIEWLIKQADFLILWVLSRPRSGVKH